MGDRSMVAFNKVRCTVITISEFQRGGMTRGAIAREVLPWADPYIAQLIKNLQDEVRMEREEQSRVQHYRTSGSNVSAA